MMDPYEVLFDPDAFVLVCKNDSKYAAPSIYSTQQPPNYDFRSEHRMEPMPLPMSAMNPSLLLT